MENLNLNQAKKIIAAFLVGRYVAKQRLEQALNLVNQRDPGAIYRLRREMGLLPEQVSDCEIFRENLAEFGELPPEARREEMPEMVRHLQICRPCHKLYWELRPLWIPLGESVKMSAKKLAEGLQLAVDQAGRLLGLTGPPPVFMPAVARSMQAAGQDDIEAPPLWQWPLEDEDAGLRLVLTVMLPDQGRTAGAEVRCELVDLSDQKVVAGKVQIALIQEETSRVVVSTLLSEILQEPMKVPPGSWVIRISYPGPQKTLAWEIPLKLKLELVADSTVQPST